MFKKTISILLLSMVFWQPLAAQNVPFSIHRLDNGLEVLLIENPALPMVGVNVVVRVGSAYEDFSTSGMSHMLEHLLFNGTTSRSQKQLYDDVDRIGGYNNANTGDFYTNFMMVAPAENIRQGMEIQADMLFHSTLPEDKFEKEKGIVLEEISKTFADPDAQLESNLNSILFEGHALSLPTLGTYSTIRGLDRDQVFEFYKNFYVPNNMRLSVIGRFDSEQMLKMINEIYGQEEPGLVRLPELSNWSFAYDVSHLKIPASGQVFHRYYSGRNSVVEFIFPLKGKLDYTLSQLIDEKLSDMAMELKAQLGKDIVQVKMNTITSPVANFVEVRLDYAGFNPDVEGLKQSVMAFLSSADFSYSPALAQTQANKIRTFFLKNLEKPHMFGIYNAQIIATSGFDNLLRTFEPQHVMAMASQLSHFKIEGEPITVVQFPRKKSTKGKSQQTKIDVRLFEARDGLPTIIVKQNPASQLIAIHYLIKHKAFWQARFGKHAAQILHDCLGQRLKSEENQIMTQKFGLSVTVNDNPYIPMDDIYLHPDFSYIRIEGLNSDLPGLIRFLNQLLLNFKPTEQEFQKAKSKFSAQGMMGRKADPARKLFDHLLEEYVYETGPYAPGPEETSYPQLLEFSKNYFQPQNMIISVVSSAEAQTVYQNFQDFKSTTAVQEVPVVTKSLKLHQQPVQIEKAGNGQRSYLFWGYSRVIEQQDHPALKALSLLLGDKIVFQIREKQGMAYHMRAGIEIRGDRALFYVSQGTRPQNVDVLLKQYATFFRPEAVKEFTEDDLQKAINMYLGRMMFRRLSSINQAYYLAHSYYFHRDINYDQMFLDALKQVTLEDVRRVAQKYLQVQNAVQIVVR